MTRLLALLSVFAFAATAASAAERQLCWEHDFTDDVRFDIEVGWATPNPLDPNPTIITPTPDADKLFAALRALESDWKTPSSIWPKSAVQIRIYDRGVLRCQAIYTREQIYAQDKDLNGFLRRPLAVSEYFDLDEALGLD